MNTIKETNINYTLSQNNLQCNVHFYLYYIFTKLKNGAICFLRKVIQNNPAALQFDFTEFILINIRQILELA